MAILDITRAIFSKPALSGTDRLALLEASISHVNDIVLITESDPISPPGPRIVYVNEAFSRLTRYTRAEAIGNTPRMMQGPKTSRSELDKMRAALVARTPVRSELINYRKDGVDIWLEIEINPMLDGHGRCTHFVSIQRDITDRKRTEWTQVLLSALVASSEDAIIAKTLDGVIRIWNPGAERLFGYSAAEVIGKPMTMLFPVDGREEEFDILDRIRRGERVQHFDSVRIRKDQTPVLVAVTVSPIVDAAGTILGASSIAHDVTAARRSEASRREQAQLLDSAQRLGGMGSWRVSLRTGELHWSPATCELFGVSQDRFKNDFDFFLSFLLPNEIENYRNVCLAASPSSPAYEVEYRIRRGDGAVRQMYERGTVEFDADGSPTSRIGMVTDITERWSQREELQISTGLLRMAGRIARIGGWSMELPGRRLTWSEEVLAIYDVATDYVPTAERAIEFLLPEYRADMLRNLQRCESDGEPFDTEVQILTAARRQIWARVIGEAIRDGSGRIIRVQGATQDLSQLKHAELAARESAERFRLLSKAAKDVIWDWDLVADSSWQSNGLPALVRLEYGGVDGGVAAFTSRIHPEDRARVVDGMRAAIAGVGDTWADSFRCRSEANGEVQVVARAYLIRDAAGRALRMVGAMTDISERLHLEAQLRQSQRLEAVGQLTGGVAHDFNNLLTVILGNAELLAEQFYDSAHGGQLARMIVSAAQRGADLTQRLLAFARKQVLDPRPLDINKLVTGVEPMLRRALGEHIELSFIGARHLPTVVVDAAQLESALLNLCLNSRDAMPGGGQLTVETLLVNVDESYVHQNPDATVGPYVVLGVSDTGTGIAPEHLGRVFDPFFTTKETGKGSGLGLAMAYGFLKQSGGHITIYSEIGHGTTVKLYLRATPTLLADERLPDAVRTTSGGSETILLVEDDAGVRQYAVSQLRSAGYTVLEACDGNAALAFIRERSDIRLLFTDIVMPGGLSGREMAQLALGMRPDLKVLYTSGYTENAMAHHGRLDPGLDLLAKPYPRAELFYRVRKALDRQTAGE